MSGAANCEIEENAESALEVVPRDDESMTLSLVPPARRDGSARLFGWIFGASLLAHTPAAFGLAKTHQVAHEKRAQEVEITLAPPPPPPEPPSPPPPPPPEAPPPKPPQQLDTPHVHLQAVPISTAPSAPVGDVPNIVATPGELAMPAPPPDVGPPAPVAVPPPPPPPPPIVEAKEGAHYRNNSRPAYPRLALREGWEGTVYLRVEVLPDGHVAQASVQRSAGHSALDEAALAVIKTWLFDPATQGGRGVLSVVTVPLQFKIQ